MRGGTQDKCHECGGRGLKVRGHCALCEVNVYKSADNWPLINILYFDIIWYFYISISDLFGSWNLELGIFVEKR
jgi:hypothetical protein